MSRDAHRDDTYLAAHVGDALANDPRVREFGLVVDVADDAVVVRGTVGTPARHEAVGTVVEEVLRNLAVERELRNETDVVALVPPDGEEVVA